MTLSEWDHLVLVAKARAKLGSVLKANKGVSMGADGSLQTIACLTCNELFNTSELSL